MSKIEKGFTIIEVVLVLAIAGLIFLMIFLALPALQRAQRDMQTKNEIAILKTSIENYKAINKGSIPAKIDSTFLDEYLDPNQAQAIKEKFNFTSSLGLILTSYQMLARGKNGNPKWVIYYAMEKKCGPENGRAYPSGKNNYALFVALESTHELYCMDDA